MLEIELIYWFSTNVIFSISGLHHDISINTRSFIRSNTIQQEITRYRRFLLLPSIINVQYVGSEIWRNQALICALYFLILLFHGLDQVIWFVIVSLLLSFQHPGCSVYVQSTILTKITLLYTQFSLFAQ